VIGTSGGELNEEKNESTEKISSWLDLPEQDFLQALENELHRQTIYGHGLKIFSKTLSHYADGEPAAIAVWNPYNGNLEIHHYGRDKNDPKEITRGIITTVSGINLNRIKLYRDSTGSLYVSDLEIKRMFLVEDYLQFKKIVGSTATLVLEMLNMLPVSEEPKQLRIYERDGKFYLPDKSDIFVRDSIVQNLIGSFNVVGSREEYQKALKELWRLLSPKQKADFVAMLGIPIIDILIDLRKLGYTKSYMLSYGSTKTGKTWIYKIGMKLLWGFDLLEGNAFWQGDSIGSQYRLHAILSSTNLPVYIDEIESRSKEVVDILKSAAIGSTSFRGTAAQSQITYVDSATLLATAQHNVYLNSKLALADELAILRRFYYNSYEQGDADKEKVHEHVLFESRLKVRGLVYDILSQYTVDQLLEIVNEIMQQVGDDTTTAGLILGAALLGLSEEEFKNLKWSGNRDLSPQEEAYELIRRDAVRVAEATFDRDYVARDLSSLIGVKEKEGKKYIVITSAYINYVNSQSSHPLKDKFHSLSDLKDLEPVFSEAELKALPVRIYEREYREWFNGRTMSVAVLPYRYIEEEDKDKLDSITQPYTNLTQNLTHILISINNKILHTYTINNASYKEQENSTPYTRIDSNLCKEPQNLQNSDTLSRQNSENMENELRNASVRPCKVCKESGSDSQPEPQPPPSPEPKPQPPPAPQAHEPDSPSFNAQAQATGSIAQPATPVLDLQNSQQVPSPSPAGSVHNATQKEQTTMLMVDKPMQQEAPAEPHEQAPSLSKEEIVQRVYLAVKLSEKDNEPFWSDPELGEPNKKLYPVLQGLTTGVIQEALKALQEEGYIMQVKPNYWHATKDLRLINLVVYNDPRSVYCPRCMRTTTQLYDYGGQWLCVDCLNELQHQNDDLYA